MYVRSAHAGQAVPLSHSRIFASCFATNSTTPDETSQKHPIHGGGYNTTGTMSLNAPRSAQRCSRVSDLECRTHGSARRKWFKKNGERQNTTSNQDTTRFMRNIRQQRGTQSDTCTAMRKQRPQHFQSVPTRQQRLAHVR